MEEWCEQDDDSADERGHGGEMSPERRRGVKGNVGRALGKAKTLSAPTGERIVPLAHAALGFGNVSDLLAWCESVGARQFGEGAK